MKSYLSFFKVILLCLSILVCSFNAQLLNVEIFNIFNLTKHQAIIQSIDVKNKDTFKEKYQESQQEVPGQIAQNKCQEFQKPYTITVNKKSINISFQNQDQSKFSFTRKKSFEPSIVEKEIYIENESEIDNTNYIRRRASFGTVFSFQFTLSEECSIHGTASQNEHVLFLIILIYGILTLIILPPFRKYLSEISRRAISFSLAVNLQMQLFVVLSILIYVWESFVDMPFKFAKIAIFLNSLLVLVVLIQFYIGVSFCFYRSLQRIQCLRKCHPVVTFVMIFLIDVGVPIIFIILPKALHFYFYCLLPIYGQIFSTVRRKSLIPTRYMIYCLTTSWTLISLSTFYPVLNFEQLSILEYYLLGLLFGFTLLVLAYARFWCKIKNGSDSHSSGSTQGYDNHLNNSESRQLPQVSQTGMVKNELDS